jgi:glycylpeptide N-tetradecanoyltransferase
MSITCKKFELCKLDYETDLEEILVFLSINYTRNLYEFKLEYSREFLKWYLQNPDTILVGIRSLLDNNILIGFTSGIPRKYSIHNKIIEAIEINLLCCHLKLRYKGIAPKLISEITRRTIFQDIECAIYTAGNNFLGKVSQQKVNFYHCILDPVKLLYVGYLEHYYKSVDFEKMEMVELKECKSAIQVVNLLNKGKFHSIISEKDVEQWLNCKDIHCYVTHDDFGFVSFFSIQYRHPKTNACIRVAQLHNIYGGINVLKSTIMKAKEIGYELFNCLNIGENKKFIESTLLKGTQLQC